MIKIFLKNGLNERSAREKNLLFFTALLLSILFFYYVLLSPAIKGREKLSRDLPLMKQQLAFMNTQAQEVKQWQRMEALSSGQYHKGNETKDIFQRSLNDLFKTHNMSNVKSTLTDSVITLQIDNIAFNDWIAFLDDARGLIKTRLIKADIRSLEKRGDVSIDATLRRYINDESN